MGFDIDRQHPEYSSKRDVWKKYRDLYAGGEQLKSNAAEYLVRRQREPGDVYAERLSRVFYENYAGSIVGWYASTLFRREPVLSFEGSNDQAKRFYGQLAEDCDLKGTNLTDFFRRQLVEGLVTGTSYTLVDFPRVDRPAGSRGEEDAIGASRAYLVEFAADDLINWSLDERGNFDWVVLRSTFLRKDRVEDEEWSTETRWSYYDKSNFRIFRRTKVGTKSSEIRLADEGRHGLAKLGRVPLFRLELPEGLWLLNRAGLLQLEHFNKTNALSWALTMGLFAMPVVYSEREWNQMVGESYFIQLGPEDRFGWTEPEGKVFEIAAANLVRLQEEIYRVCYLGHAGGSISKATPQSGLSKQRDFSITQEVLRAYGDAIKDHMRRVLKAIEAAREDGLEIGVTGLDEFDIGDFSSDLEDGERLLKMAIGSPTLEREVRKKLALKYLCDVRQDVKDRITQELEA